MTRSTTAGIFVTGTDTDVGKTWITGALARGLRDRGLDVGVWKPVQSGARTGNPNADSHVLKHLSGVVDDEDDITPYSYLAPLTPAIAAFVENASFTIPQLVSGGDAILRKHKNVLVEGAGGLAVPLTSTAMVVDLAVALGYPLIIVARAGLGTINHTLLTIDYARHRGLTIAGVVFNGFRSAIPPDVESMSALPPGDLAHYSETTNPFMVRHFADVPVLGMVPHLSTPPDLQDLPNLIHCHLDLDKVSDCLASQH